MLPNAFIQEYVDLFELGAGTVMKQLLGCLGSF